MWRCSGYHSYARYLKFLCSLLAVLGASALSVSAAYGQEFNVLHTFTGPDGAAPMTMPAQGPDGALYGTTSYGGDSWPKPYLGVIYRITLDGTYSVLHNFVYATGGGSSGGLVLAPDGTFYGPGVAGPGVNLNGVLFSYNAGAGYSVLYYFTNTGDGTEPIGTMCLAADGNLYGVTNNNGGFGTDAGTVYRVAPDGTFTTIYNFGSSAPADVTSPQTGFLQMSDGALYGIGVTGGTNGYGGVYRITTEGALTTVHSFEQSDGFASISSVQVIGNLVQGIDGALYGVGPTSGANYAGHIFRLTLDGTYSVLYSFSQPVTSGQGYSTNPDGIAPNGLTVGPDGTLYGAAGQGGPNGGGTIFEISPAGAFSVLYAFSAVNSQNTDGNVPRMAPVRASDGNLYGVTQFGGSAGLGTIYQITLPVKVYSLTLNPASVTGGSRSIATVTLSKPAPAGGVVVKLASSSKSAEPPASITVAAGKSSATATIATQRVTADTAATIQAKLGSTAVKASLAIDVQTFTLTPSSGSNGSISPDTAQTVDYGKDVSFDGAPAIGYKVNQWLLDGKVVSGATGRTYKLTDVTANHSVKVTFEKQTFTVTPTAGANGTISPSTVQTVGYGGSVKFKAVPASGHTVNQWTVDGKLVQTGGSSYTLSAVMSNQTVKVTFK